MIQVVRDLDWAASWSSISTTSLANDQSVTGSVTTAPLASEPPGIGPKGPSWKRAPTNTRPTNTANTRTRRMTQRSTTIGVPPDVSLASTRPRVKMRWHLAPVDLVVRDLDTELVQ